MEREERKGIGIVRTLARYKYVLLVAAVGAALLLWPSGEASQEISVPPVSAQQSRSLSEAEGAMEDILSKIKGVGRVDVMLTLESGNELVLATDTTLRYSGNTQSPDDYSRSSDTVTVSGSGEKGVVVTQENCPVYRGALIVCDGGGNDKVKLAVTEAVAALTGLGADKIAVVEWQSGSTVE